MASPPLRSGPLGNIVFITAVGYTASKLPAIYCESLSHIMLFVGQLHLSDLATEIHGVPTP